MTTLVRKQDMEKQMRTTVKNTVPAITALYQQAKDLEKKDKKEEWDRLTINDVEPMMKELNILRTAAEHCLDLQKRPFLSESGIAFNAIISEEIQKQENSELAEVALTWGRKVYSTLAMLKEIKTYI